MRSRAQDGLRRRVSPRECPELMDGACSYEEFRDCLRSLEQVNRWFLGYRPTLRWLEQRPRKNSAPLHILDAGSGGGDMLRQIARWGRRRGIAMRLTGIDLNPYAARAATEATPKEFGIQWLTGDAMQYEAGATADIIISSLMTHHLEDEDVTAFLQWMDRTARLGWFVNDLERSEQTAAIFGWTAAAMRWHPFVRHDGPVSFRRAFRKEDWAHLLVEAGIRQEDVTVERWRPGRLCVGRWRCSDGLDAGRPDVERS